MVTRLILNEELEKDSRLACKKCYHILVRKPNYECVSVTLSLFGLLGATNAVYTVYGLVLDMLAPREA